MVGNSLLAFEEGESIKVFEYKDIHDPDSMKKVKKKPLQKQIYDFALCLILNRFVLLTGGTSEEMGHTGSKNCFVYDA